MYRASGIFREVYLLSRERARITDVFVKPELSRGLTSASLDVEISANAKTELEYKLFDKGGTPVAFGKASVSGTARFSEALERRVSVSLYTFDKIGRRISFLPHWL